MEKIAVQFNSLSETDIYAEIGENNSITQLLAQAPQYLDCFESKGFTSVFIKRMGYWERQDKDTLWKTDDTFLFLCDNERPPLGSISGTYSHSLLHFSST